MKEQRINIACNIDSNYVKYCIVMLTSLIENNKDSLFNIHIITDDLSDNDKSMIDKIVKNRYHQEINYYHIDKDLIKDCIIDKESHISIATYYRIFLESILDESIDKLIYLDCDLVIVGSIIDLWNTDISNYAVGCIEDMWSGKDDNYTRLNYDKSFSYFNAGVLLINLKYLRFIRFQDNAIAFINKNSHKLLFNDQDVLNALLHDKKLLLPFRYNLQDGFYRIKRRIMPSSEEELNKEINHPVIVHYTGSKKPWNYKSQHPLRGDYFKYLDMTPWNGERPHKPLSYIFICLINTLLTKLNIIKKKYR